MTRYAPGVDLSGVACIPASGISLTSGGPYGTPRFGFFNLSTKPEHLSFHVPILHLVCSSSLEAGQFGLRLMPSKYVSSYYTSAEGGTKWRVNSGVWGRCPSAMRERAERILSEIYTNTINLVLGCPTPQLRSAKPEEEFINPRISLHQSPEISACTSGG